MAQDTPPPKLIESIRSAEDLAALVELFGAESVHEAYFGATEHWESYQLQRQEQDENGHTEGLPGTCVTVDGTDFHVHGVTHAGTDAEQQ